MKERIGLWGKGGGGRKDERGENLKPEGKRRERGVLPQILADNRRSRREGRRLATQNAEIAKMEEIGSFNSRLYGITACHGRGVISKKSERSGDPDAGRELVEGWRDMPWL
jgi:hypothetical protein